MPASYTVPVHAMPQRQEARPPDGTYLRTANDLGGLAALFERATIRLQNEPLADAATQHNLADLRERLASQRPHLAVLGQFKRGKSSLLNALLGEELLPVSVIPLTAVPIFIDHGPEKVLRIFYDDSRAPDEFRAARGDDLAAQLWRVSAEEANAHNRLGVQRIELYHPASLLREGVTLIDTPGVGSTFRHNTEATLGFLANCDAALFVVSADPPITEREIEFLVEVRAHVPKLVFVMNKVDYLDASGRDVAVAFLRRVLTENGLHDGEFDIFCVSARDALDALRTANSVLLSRSGLPDLERFLVNFLAKEKGTLLQVALASKAAGLLASVAFQADLSLRALELPLEDLESRMAKFDTALAEIERERIAAQDLLNGDLKRAREQLEEDAKAVTTRVRQHAETEIERAASESPASEFEARVERAIAAAMENMFPREFDDISRVWETRLNQTFETHQRRATAMVEVVRRTAADLFDIPRPDDSIVSGFERLRRPHWDTGEIKVTLEPLHRAITDRLMPASLRKRKRKARALARADELIHRNVEALRWATLQNINQSFRRFSTWLDEQLRESIEATHGAIRTAQDRRRAGARQTSDEIARLTSAKFDLLELKDAFASYAPR